MLRRGPAGHLPACCRLLQICRVENMIWNVSKEVPQHYGPRKIYMEAGSVSGMFHRYSIHRTHGTYVKRYFAKDFGRAPIAGIFHEHESMHKALPALRELENFLHDWCMSEIFCNSRWAALHQYCRPCWTCTNHEKVPGARRARRASHRLWRLKSFLQSANFCHVLH